MKSLSYQQVYLVPRKGILCSRSGADLSTMFLGRAFRAPWLPANMGAVVNPEICKWLSENDYPYIMHRFGDTLDFVRRANREKWKLISISVGVKPSDQEMLKKIAEEGLRVDWICIDVAHGHHGLVRDMIEYIGDLYINLPRNVNSTNCPFIIAGNVATAEAVRDLDDWGADAVKCGVGGGSPCSTKNMTGFHVPMFSCALECCKGSPVPIILDGGIREPGDIVKALVAGYSVGDSEILVMCGSLFAACKDAPGENIIAT